MIFLEPLHHHVRPHHEFVLKMPGRTFWGSDGNLHCAVIEYKIVVGAKTREEAGRLAREHINAVHPSYLLNV